MGFRTKYLEYENVERAAGQTKWSFWGLLRYSLEGILAFSAAPLLLAPILGGCFLLAGFVMLILRLCALDVSLLCAALFLVGGSQLLCLGILGAYFSKMYWEVKKRPIYILKEIQK